MAKTEDTVKSTLTMTKRHRHRVGDKVVMSHRDHDEALHVNDDPESVDYQVGTITDITNEPGTYVSVDFGEKGTFILTEDDVVRTDVE